MNDCCALFKQENINSSDSMKLVLMLYDGSINFLHKAIEYGEKGDVKNRNIFVNKANDIIVELDHSVNDEAGGELSKNLKWLYSFMNRHLMEAVQREDSTKRLNEVVTMLSNLRGSWRYVDSWIQNGMAKDQEITQMAVQ
jgi:flagellar protein FliS